MLADLVPAAMVRLFARPYIAGSTMTSALDIAANLLRSRRMLATLDLLAEEVIEAAQAQTNERLYRELIEAISADPRFRDPADRPTVSVKPSAFSDTDNQDAAFRPIRRLAEAASDLGLRLTVDMEDHRWTDITLTNAIQLFTDGHDVGTVLQTRLHRTADDVNRIPVGMRVRLVIGIYPEPATIATTSKQEMKQRLLETSRTLLERGAFVEFATHDEAILRRFTDEVAPLKPEHCEVQQLLGVPTTSLQDRIRIGDLGHALPVRLYVPFAVSWDDATAYLRRRMSESPSIVLLAFRNLMTRDR